MICIFLSLSYTGYFFFFFFFQAEDGIRDLIVTGVQTCALPISLAGRRASDASLHAGDRGGRYLQGRFSFAFDHERLGVTAAAAQTADELSLRPEIGRASCRERV